MIVKGFPTLIKEVEIPNIGEILNMQFTDLCQIDDFRKNGNEYQRYLVDNLQLKGMTDQVGVTFHVQYLFPGTAPLPERMGVVEEWHADSDVFLSVEENPYRSHLLLTDCECLTEFNDVEFNLDTSLLDTQDTAGFNKYLSYNSHLLVPKAMPSNSIVSFEEHPHKIVLPTKPQLRFMFRVVESLSCPIRNWDDSLVSAGRVGRGREYISTVKKSSGKILLDSGWYNEEYYSNYDEYRQ